MTNLGTATRMFAKMLRGKLRIEGILGNLTTLNQVTRLFSVQGGGEGETGRP